MDAENNSLSLTSAEVSPGDAQATATPVVAEQISSTSVPTLGGMTIPDFTKTSPVYGALAATLGGMQLPAGGTGPSTLNRPASASPQPNPQTSSVSLPSVAAGGSKSYTGGSPTFNEHVVAATQDTGSPAPQVTIDSPWVSRVQTAPFSAWSGVKPLKGVA